MKKYVKSKVVAKNNTAGSYAAGCGLKTHSSCYVCEMVM